MTHEALVTVTVDGTPVSVPKGTLVIEAAKQAGVLVPHYCYHPGLAVAGVCRMCLVEIEKAPKLQVACSTQVAEGMIVHTKSASAKAGRQGVLELLLINHPLDCPICDQAGECELQDFVFQEGRPATRYSPDFAKRFNPVEDFGPDVLYVPNRCILCTRCVRFMEDVAKAPVPEASRSGGTGPSSGSIPRHHSTTRGPGTWWICVRWARSCRKTSCTAREPGSWTRPPRSARAARKDAT